MTKHSIDAVLLYVTGTDELVTAINFFSAMQRAGSVQHQTYSSACGDHTSPEAVRNMMRTYSAEHLLVKTNIEQQLVHAEFSWTTTRLRPSLS